MRGLNLSALSGKTEQSGVAAATDARIEIALISVGDFVAAVRWALWCPASFALPLFLLLFCVRVCFLCLFPGFSNTCTRSKVATKASKDGVV
jgi:hypothetical protein